MYSVKQKISIAVATIVIGFLVALLAAVIAVQIANGSNDCPDDAKREPAAVANVTF